MKFADDPAAIAAESLASARRMRLAIFLAVLVQSLVCAGLYFLPAPGRAIPLVHSQPQQHKGAPTKTEGSGSSTVIREVSDVQSAAEPPAKGMAFYVVLAVLALLAGCFWAMRRQQQKKVTIPVKVRQRSSGNLPASGADMALSAADYEDSFIPRWPWVTTVIVAVNLVVYALMARGDGYFSVQSSHTLLEWGGSFGPLTTHGQWWRLLTANYLHGHWLHILVNMYSLWALGPALERTLGRVSFLLLYTFSGVLGSMVSVYFHPYVIGVGASGALFGVMGALLAYSLFFAKLDGMPPEIVSNVRRSLFKCIGINVVIGLSLFWLVDNAAHVGGLLAGFVLGIVLAWRSATSDFPSRFTLPRSAIGAVTGAVLVAALWWITPPAIDIDHETAELDKIGQDAIAKCKSLAASSELSDAAFATALEHEVVPAWRSAVQARLARLDSLPSPIRGHLQEAVAKREEFWKSFIDEARGRARAEVRGELAEPRYVGDEQHGANGPTAQDRDKLPTGPLSGLAELNHRHRGESLETSPSTAKGPSLTEATTDGPAPTESLREWRARMGTTD